MQTLPRVFISYARNDGTALARSLRDRLTYEHDIATIQDLTTLEGGKDWWSQIVTAIKTVEYLVLIVTPEALRSEVTRREWQLARREGVCVVPIMGSDAIEPGALPPWLQRIHLVDPQIPEQWRRFVRTLESPCRMARVPQMAPEVPVDYVDRPGEMEALLKYLMDEERSEPIAITTALHGTGGFGKTTLAAAVCRRSDIQDAFCDGILWVTLGREPGDLKARVEDLIHILTNKRPGFANVEAAEVRLAQELGDRRILLVIDDVWSTADVTPFLRGGNQCTRIITTRSTSVVPLEARRVRVDAMREEESISLLSGGLPPMAHDVLSPIAHRLGRWPLLLRLTNGVLRERTYGARQPVIDALHYVEKALDRRGVAAFDSADPDIRSRSVKGVLDVSIDLLDTNEQSRLFELSIFPEDAKIPVNAVATLWASTAGMDELETEELCQRLYEMSLLQEFDLSSGTLRVHDVIRAYLRKQPRETLVELNRTFLDAVRVTPWSMLSAEQNYLWNHLAYHLVEADCSEELRVLLLDFDWLLAKLEATDIGSLIADYSYLPNDQSLQTLGEALRLSAHALGDDKYQLAAQLLGRMASPVSEKIAQLIGRARDWYGGTLFEPVRASMTQPGGPLIRTLKQHTASVNSVRSCSHGQVVSASSDGTLKLWALESGTVLHTFKQHTSAVNCVAVTDDGRTAISGGQDRNVLVWNLQLGTLASSLPHNDTPVTAICVDQRGERVVAGCVDGVIVAWDRLSGDVVFRLQAHLGTVNAIWIARDCQHFYTGGTDGIIHFWNLSNGAHVRQLDCHAGWVLALTEDENAGCLLAGSDDARVCRISLESDTECEVIGECPSGVQALAIFDDNKRLAGVCDDGTIEVWNLVDGSALSSMSGHDDPIFDITPIPKSALAVTGSADGSLKLWDLGRSEQAPAVQGHLDRILAIAMSRSGDIVVTASEDNSVKVWNAEGTCLGEFAEMAEEQRILAVDADGTIAVGGTQEGELIIWNLRTLKPSARIHAHDGEVNDLVFSPDGHWFASGSDDGTVKAWTRDLTTVRTYTWPHPRRIHKLTITPDARAIIATAQGGDIMLWNLETGEKQAFWPNTESTAVAARWSRSGWSLALLSPDGELRVGAPTNDAEVSIQSDDFSNAISVTPTMSRLLSASAEGKLSLWDLHTGKREASLDFDRRLSTCALSSDGRFAVAGEQHGRVHFLKVRETQ